MNDAGAPPTCSLREAIAFLRDPAAFTAGAGVGIADLYRVPVPGARLYVVTDPEVLERILVREADHFVKSHLYWGALRRALGPSMATMDGDDWEYLHRLQRPFFTRKAVEQYLPTVATHSLSFFARLTQTLPERSDIPLLETLAELNVRLTLAVLFGREDEPNAALVARRIAEGHAIIGWVARFPWRYRLLTLSTMGRRASAHRSFFTDYVQGLKSLVGSRPSGQLFDELMGIPTTGSEGYPDTIARNEIIFHLGAGTETQAAAEGWALYLLWRHPLVLKRLRTEIESVARGTPVNDTHLADLTYTRQVLHEALRLYPPVYGILRDCVRQVDLGSHLARPGDSFLISVYGLHRSPRHWSDPDDFKPERFAEEESAAIRKYQYAPFGAGRHVCIAQHFALSTMLLTIALFVQQFDWSFTEGKVRAGARPSLKPTGDFRTVLSPRR